MAAEQDARDFLDKVIGYEPNWSGFEAVIDFDGLQAINPGLAFSMLEFSACSPNGGHDAVKFLQGLVKVPEDGVMGPATLAAIKQVDPVALIKAIYAELSGSTANAFDTSLNHALALAGAPLVPTKEPAPVADTPVVPPASPPATNASPPTWLTAVNAFLDANSFMAPIVAWLPFVPASAKPLIAQIPQANAALKAQIANLVTPGATVPTLTTVAGSIPTALADLKTAITALEAALGK